MRHNPDKDDPKIRDQWIRKFLAHLATDRGASVYTQRNYRQALTEFVALASGRAQVAARLGKTCSAMIFAAICGFSDETI